MIQDLNYSAPESTTTTTDIPVSRFMQITRKQRRAHIRSIEKEHLKLYNFLNKAAPFIYQFTVDELKVFGNGLSEDKEKQDIYNFIKKDLVRLIYIENDLKIAKKIKHGYVERITYNSKQQET